MKVGDVVKVIIQPTDLGAQVGGEVGFIEEIKGDYASITALKLNGDCGGGGGVPLDCLELETDSKWLEAKEKYDKRINAHYEESKIRTERYKKVLKAVSEKYNVSELKAKKIRNILNTWEEYYWENLHDE